MDLTIIVPQYKEPISIVSELLNSINNQQYVDFSNIEVLIGNDGSNVILKQEELTGYKFPVTYYAFKHVGVSAVRNALLKKAKGDYIIFCDADDCFISLLAISRMLSFARENNADLVMSAFIESSLRDNKIYFISHEQDVDHLHGNMYKREYLINNNIFFPVNITANEDSIFNDFAIYSTEKKFVTNFETYLWKYNPNSVVRSDRDFSLKHQHILLEHNLTFIDFLLKNNHINEARNRIASTIYQTYTLLYTANPLWFDKKYENTRNIIVELSKKLYNKYKEEYKNVPENSFAEMKKFIDNHYHATCYENTITYQEFVNELEK